MNASNSNNESVEMANDVENGNNNSAGDVDTEIGNQDSIPLPRPPTTTSPMPPSNSTMDKYTPLLRQQQQQQQQELENDFVVIVLDGLHRKFRVPASPDWTVAEFKTAGASIHQVASPAQRLIFMGRMLQDNVTLTDCGIKNSETIIHLFPKPTMVITDSNSNANAQNGSINASNDADDNSATDPQINNDSRGDRAHIPQIVLDAEEARRSSSMVIFTSSEMFEAQHRVKLFSFFLLFISTMELLTLVSIMLGASAEPYMGIDDEYIPGDPTDGGISGGAQMRSWKNSDYADLVIAVFGFYVATLGIRTTTENTLVSAKRYFYGLLIVGIAWIAYYYYLDIVAEKSDMDGNSNSADSEDDGSKPNIYAQALVSASLPICIWGICFLKAYQFQQLVRQAEQEAAERHSRFTRELERGTMNGGADESSIGVLALGFGGDHQERNTSASEEDDRTPGSARHESSDGRSLI